MKTTADMLKAAVEKLNENKARLYIPDSYLVELAGILTAESDSEWLTYPVTFEDGHENGGADNESLIDVIENGAEDGEYIYITVQHGDTDEPASLTIVGHSRCHYRQNGVFLDVVKEDGAGIGLARLLNEIVAARAAAKHEKTDEEASATIQVEINKNFEPAQTLVAGAGFALSITPPLDEDYWMFRVKLFKDQAMLGFPKHGTIGIGFAQEEDWNTNFPYTVDALKTYNHIKHNKKYDEITDQQCLEAIKAIQECAKAYREQKG